MLLMTAPALAKPAKAASGTTLEIVVTTQQAPAVQGVIPAYLNSSYAKDAGITNVKVVSDGSQANNQLTYVTTQMAAKSSQFDVIGMDTSWTAQFASNGWVIPLTNVTSTEMSNYVPGLVSAGTYKGTLYAYPYFANLGVLYYRADLLRDVGATTANITTWEGLNATANAILNNVTIQHNYPNLVGYVGQFDNYEGGTCNFLEWLGSNGLTNIFYANGSADLNNPKAVQAMTFLQNLVAPRYTGMFNNSYIIPRDALTMDEGSSVGVWYAGNAIFMRQWTFAYGGSMSAQPINATVGGNYTQFGVVPIPHFAGATNYKTSEIGGAVLGISEYSTHQSAALGLIRFLGQSLAQTFELTNVSNFPALLSVYNNLPSAYSWAKSFLPAFNYTLARPVLKDYADISSQLSYYFTNILDDAYSAQVGLDKMNAAVNQVIAPAPTTPSIPGASIPLLMVAAISMIGILIARKRKSFKSI